jgi:hypothetical protein
VRRRDVLDAPDAPDKLRRYRPQDWPDPAAWYAARQHYWLSGRDLPGLDPDSDAPDVPFDGSDV